MNVSFNATNNTVTVNYPAKRQEIVLTRAEHDLIVSIRTHYKVAAIKFVKEQYNLDLYSAKQIVDTILEEVV